MGEKAETYQLGGVGKKEMGGWLAGKRRRAGEPASIVLVIYMRTGDVWKSLVQDFVWRTRAQHPMRRMDELAVECLDQHGGRSRLDVCGNQLSDMHASHKLSLAARETQETGWRRA